MHVLSFTNGQVYIMHVWFRSIYLQCKLSMPISLCVYNQKIFFGLFMQLWHKYKNYLFKSVLYVLFFVYFLSQIHALLSKLRSLGYFIALGMRLTYELFLKGMNFLLQKNKNDELSRIAGELSIQGDQNEAEDDLLNLMDSAWWEEYCIMGKMEWPAGPDLCNIFVSVIFLFVVHCHEFRMKATFYFCNFWSQNLILFIVINQSPSVWIQLNCWDFPLLISLTRVIFIYFFKNIFVELNLWILNCMLIHLPLLLFH